MKLFISYARVDKPLCKQIVDQLNAVHEVWYDRRLHAGQAWWEEIQRQLAWCEGFVYLLSPESVNSEYCQKEYAIAADAGKHIFPVLIQARTEFPDSLSHIHYADLSNGMEDVITLLNAVYVAEKQGWVRPSPPKLPVKQPEKPPKTLSPNKAIAQAADAMEDENFDNAVFLIKQALENNPAGRNQRILKSMLDEAETALEHQTYLREAAREYAPIVEAVKRARTRAIGCEEFADFRQHFPDYDPDNIADLCKEHAEPVGAEHDPPAKPPRANAKPKTIDLLPKPFEWIEIPGGHGTMKTDESVVLEIPTERYWMAKYPVTNLQFAEFIKAGGYKNQQWWTDAGWQQREKGWVWDSNKRDFVETGTPWTEPRYWGDAKWNGVEQPVVGVSWYEAIAFCLWLRDVTGEKIMLPTEAQWQYAAQGDDGREYPWGNDWDAACCNTSESKIGKTTPVIQYEGKGDSPFGVVDMVGNVWEWCLTDYKTGTNDYNSDVNSRVLRGGSWSSSLISLRAPRAAITTLRTTVTTTSVFGWCVPLLCRYYWTL